MTTVAHRIRAAVLILALSLAGCSGGGANDPAQQPTEDVTSQHAAGRHNYPSPDR
jgi:PBP1b-binding outer membrane lipoprotein LpoB